MFEAGLIEETQRLVEKYGEAAGPLSSLGYKQAAAISSWRTDARAGAPSRSAGSPQLCQTANDMVSPRAGGPLAARFRRRGADSARSCGSYRHRTRHGFHESWRMTGRTANAHHFCYRSRMPRTLALLLLILVSRHVSIRQRKISAPRPHSSNPRRRKVGGEDSAQADPRRESRAGLHDLVPRQFSERRKSGISAMARRDPEISRRLIRHDGPRRRPVSSAQRTLRSR